MWKIWREWRGFLALVVVMMVFRSAVADWNHVPSGSMLPNILIGDRIVVDKLAYDLRIPFTLNRLGRWQDPLRGDVVTFESPVNGRLLVKRVIGIAGDQVTMQDNRLIINGYPANYQTVVSESALTAAKHASYDYTFHQESVLGHERIIRLTSPSQLGHQNFGPVTVPAHHYLMLGDNRDNSQDSRYFGFVHRDLITGQATRIAFSVDYGHYYLPRSDRFLRPLE